MTDTQKIISEMKISLNNLETVKNHYLFSSTDVLLDNYEMPPLLCTSLQHLKLDIEELEIANNFSSYLRKVEMERNQLKMENQRLELEHIYLKEDLHDTQQKLRICEQVVVQLEEENKHLQFMLSLRTNEENNTKKKSVTMMEIDNDKRGGVKTLHNTTFYNETEFQELLEQEKKYFIHTEDNNKKIDFFNDESENLNKTFIMKVHSSESINLFGLNNKNQSKEIPFELITERLIALHNVITQYGAKNNENPPTGDDVVEDNYVYPRIHIATMLNIIALIHRDLNNYKEAAQLLKEALAIRLTNYGEHHTTIVVTLNSLAKVYEKCEMHEEAEASSKRALRIKEEIDNRNHLNLTVSQEGQPDQLSYEVFAEENQGLLCEVDSYNESKVQLTN
uniref:TPR_REGION domain-containing protein n=1 Tax=Glossina brevipalpis TaxID=37001 RepID=A0A1A9X4D1_9MUSC